MIAKDMGTTCPAPWAHVIAQSNKYEQIIANIFDYGYHMGINPSFMQSNQVGVMGMSNSLKSIICKYPQLSKITKLSFVSHMISLSTLVKVLLSYLFMIAQDTNLFNSKRTKFFLHDHSQLLLACHSHTSRLALITLQFSNR